MYVYFLEPCETNRWEKLPVMHARDVRHAVRVKTSFLNMQLQLDHTETMHEVPVLVASKGFGEEIGEIFVRRDGLHFQLFSVETVHEEELGIDVLGAIGLDVALLHLSNTCTVVVVDCDW